MVDFRDRPVENLLRRLQDMLVEDVVVRVDEFDGDFEMSPSSDLFRRLTRHGRYEPELARMFQSYGRPDEDVIDVGAKHRLLHCGRRSAAQHRAERHG